MTRSMLVKQSISFNQKHQILSLQICGAKQSGWPGNPVDYRILGLMQECVYIVQVICLRHQWLEAVPHWHMGKHITKRHRQNSWSMEKVVTCKHEGERTSLYTSAKLKPALFRANTLHNRLFSEPPTVYWGKHVSPQFHCIYLKANKVSKSKGIRKLNMYIIFESLMMLFINNYQNESVLVETTTCKSWHVFWDTTYYY